MSATIFVLFVGICFLLKASMVGFGITCAGYLALLFGFTAWSRSRVDPSHRRRPDLPAEMRGLSLGPIRPELLALADLKDSRAIGAEDRRLFEITRAFESGFWRCRFEESSGTIIAYSVEFISRFTPVLDYAKARGSGTFFPPPPSG
ncbi:MAG: hypothetical protein R3F11_07490 [Verrucomicrobiales bacterium]